MSGASLFHLRIRIPIDDHDLGAYRRLIRIMTTGKVAVLETRKPPASRVIYALLVVAVLCMVGVSFYLHLFDLTYYRFSFLDPSIGWLGCLVSLIAIFPLTARLRISGRVWTYGVA